MCPTAIDNTGIFCLINVKMENVDAVIMTKSSQSILASVDESDWIKSDACWCLFGKHAPPFCIQSYIAHIQTFSAPISKVDRSI